MERKKKNSIPAHLQSPEKPLGITQAGTVCVDVHALEHSDIPGPSTPATSPPRFAFWTSVGALIDPLSLLVERLVRRLPASRRRQSTLNQPRGVGDIGTEGGDASRETERRARLHLRRRRIWRTGRARGLCGTPRAPARRRRRRRRARRCRRQVARAAPVRREVRWLRLAEERGGERRVRCRPAAGEGEAPRRRHWRKDEEASTSSRSARRRRAARHRHRRHNPVSRRRPASSISHLRHKSRRGPR